VMTQAQCERQILALETIARHIALLSEVMASVDHALRHQEPQDQDEQPPEPIKTYLDGSPCE
jgi:hypothetical protein